MNLKQFKSKMLVNFIHVHFMLIKMEHHETPTSTIKSPNCGLFIVPIRYENLALSFDSLDEIIAIYLYLEANKLDL